MTALDRASLDCWYVDQARIDERLMVDSVYRSIQGRDEPMRRTAALLIQGRTEREIGSAIGKSQPTVSRYVHTLRSTLASLLDPSYA